MANRKVKLLEIAKKLQVLAGSIENKVHEDLHVSRVSSRWVPRNLRVHNRYQRVASYQQLNFYTSDKKKFCRRLVTGDERWIHRCSVYGTQKAY